MSSELDRQSSAMIAPAPPAPPRVPLSVPHLGGREEEYLRACVRDNWVSSVGPFVGEFEARFAAAVGAGHAVACASGTAALHLALHALGIGAGDIVLVSTLTFIAPVNAVCYTGAAPVLVDSAAATWQIAPELVERFLAEDCRMEGGRCIHQATGRRVAALLPVHILGHAADVARFTDLAERFNVTLVEDASEALGVTIGGRHAGRFGAAGCFSFNGNKTITTGSGGMVVTDDPALAARVRFLSQQAKLPGSEYKHSEIGFNYRMSNLHAAVGLAQLEQLDGHLRRKREIATRYGDALRDIAGLRWIAPAPGSEGAWWLFTITLDPAVAGLTARELMARLDAAGIESRPLWQPLHLSPAHAGRLVLGGATAAHFYETALSLPCSVGLSEADQDRVIAEVRRALGRDAVAR